MPISLALQKQLLSIKPQVHLPLETESHRNRSRKPHHHPNQHTEDEINLIMNMRRHYPNASLIVFCVKLRQRRYSRSILRLCLFSHRQNMMAVSNLETGSVLKASIVVTSALVLTFDRMLIFVSIYHFVFLIE